MTPRSGSASIDAADAIRQGTLAHMKTQPRFGLVALLLAALAAVPARSYVLEVIEGTDIPRRWAKRSVALCLDAGALPAGIDGADFRSAIEASAAAWSALDCDGVPTPFEFVVLDAATADPASCVHRISWVHDKAAWPYGDYSIANTNVTADPATGEILDADLELNAAHHRWVLDAPDSTTYDLQNAVTHEIGHVLGLDHTPVGEATMNESVSLGDVADRSLHEDDIAGYCALHGPNAVPWPKVDAPDGDDVGVSTSPGSCSPAPTPQRFVPVALLLLAALFLRQRRAPTRSTSLVPRGASAPRSPGPGRGFAPDTRRSRPGR